MAMPRKSLEQHAIEGTKPHYDTGKQSSHIPGARPHAPQFLNDACKKKFRQLARLLEKRRVATSGDAELLTQYVVLWERWLIAQKHVSDEGSVIAEQRYSKNGDPYTVNVKNPWLDVAQFTEKQMAANLAALGLTVTTRDRAKQTAANPTTEILPGSAADFLSRNVIPITQTPAMRIQPEEMVAQEPDSGDAN